MSTILGIPSGKMIRTSVNSDTDDLGLSRLTESYAFASSELNTFHARFKNLTPYNTIMSFVHPLPTTTYPYVVIESVSITEDAGGISRATIQYVGILKTSTASRGDISWLPPAKQKLQPKFSAYNPLSVIVDFIYYSDVEPKELGLLKAHGTGTPLPPAINGTLLYRSIIAPFSTEELAFNFNASLGFPVQGTLTSTPYIRAPQYIASKTVYFGMACTAHFSERIGLFYKVTNTYEDSGFDQTPTGIISFGAPQVR